MKALLIIVIALAFAFFLLNAYFAAQPDNPYAAFNGLVALGNLTAGIVAGIVLAEVGDD